MALLAPFVMATVVGLWLLWPERADSDLGEGLGAPSRLVDATVVEVRTGACAGSTEEESLRCDLPTVRLDTGPDEGREVELPEQPRTGPALRIEEGDELVLGYFPESEPGFRYAFADRQRREPLFVLGIVFAAAVIGFGRWKGLRALLGLGASLLILARFALPALLEGSDPLAVSLVAAGAIAVLALFLAHGVSRSTAIALLGTLLSLTLVGVLAAVFVGAAELSGLTDEESTILQVSAAQVDLRGLVLGGVVIGALGVLDDVTVTQVAAVGELRRADPGMGPTAVYRSAVRIGRDHIASTVNTLVLAYAGASLSLLLLFTQLNQRLLDVLNGEVVAVEIVRTLVGGIGLVAAVPLTTALAVALNTGSPPAVEPNEVAAPMDVRTRGERRFWRG